MGGYLHEDMKMMLFTFCILIRSMQYGGLGYVAGHEISHGFDVSGKMLTLIIRVHGILSIGRSQHHGKFFFLCVYLQECTTTRMEIILVGGLTHLNMLSR